MRRDRPSAADCTQVQLMASTEPKCAVPMVAQFIVSIGMHEHIERSVIERKPTHDVGKLRRRKRDLVAPSWMGSDLSLVKAAHLDSIAKLGGHRFAKFPGGIATGRIEIDMRMPARDTRHIEIVHRPPFGCRTLHYAWSTLHIDAATIICRGSNTPLPKGVLPMTVARISEISSISSKSFEDAIILGVARANKTLKNVKGAWVKDQEVTIEKARWSATR